MKAGKFIFAFLVWMAPICLGSSLESPGMKAPAPCEHVPRHPDASYGHPQSSPSMESTRSSYLTDTALGLMAIYSNLLHPGISRGCPSHPSCSHYMKSAVIRFGVPTGIILGLERLLHETGELYHGFPISTPDGVKIYDPLDNNVFWWHNSVNEPDHSTPLRDIYSATGNHPCRSVRW